MGDVVYDTGALLAAERRDARLGRLHQNRVDGREPKAIVPVVVLAQAWRGGPQDGISRVLRYCEVVADTEALGRAAGTACAKAGTSDVVDAIVVVTALARGAAVVTSDPKDLLQLAAALGRTLPILVV